MPITFHVSAQRCPFGPPRCGNYAQRRTYRQRLSVCSDLAKNALGLIRPRNMAFLCSPYCFASRAAPTQARPYLFSPWITEYLNLVSAYTLYFTRVCRLYIGPFCMRMCPFYRCGVSVSFSCGPCSDSGALLHAARDRQKITAISSAVTKLPNKRVCFRNADRVFHPFCVRHVSIMSLSPPIIFLISKIIYS